ncbi:hypothetical protein BHE74_00032840 [Ensete ventricosum]|nr:hypothetical protein BHE74_00032840 [Ensete ventricosum]
MVGTLLNAYENSGSDHPTLVMSLITASDFFPRTLWLSGHSGPLSSDKRSSEWFPRLENEKWAPFRNKRCPIVGDAALLPCERQIRK